MTVMSLDTKKIDGNPKYCHPPTREGDLCKPTRYKEDFVKKKMLIHNTISCIIKNIKTHSINMIYAI